MDNSTTQPIDEIRREKRRKLEALQDLGVNLFPNTPQFNLKTVQSARNATADQTVIKPSPKGAPPRGSTTAVAGRVISIRGHGKIRFIDLQDETGTIQTAFKFDSLGKDQMTISESIDTGDFIEVQGTIFTTDKGELTIKVTDFHFLAKALRPIPDQHEGFKDKELRLRKRYLDLLVNQDVRRVFEIRHRLTRGIRNFLDQYGLTEVETPILQPLYGGANAQPFTTHINSLNTDAYLRIAPELYLKRLLVGGLQGVYELAKDFRNEGIDQTHYPEFTMLEAYVAFWDYQHMMDLMEKMVKKLAAEVLDGDELIVHKQSIKLSHDWPRISMTKLIDQQLATRIESLELPELLTLAGQNNLDLPVQVSRGEVVFTLFDKLITPHLIEPTWVIDYPSEVSPLAKNHPRLAGFTERFELYIGGKEIMDGWSEINNPLIQRERLEAEKKRSFDETETAQPIDEDYIEAMEYGMPPAAGVGAGIDRLTMLFTNTWSIQETILFPFKKPL